MALKRLKLVILVSHCSESFQNSMDRLCLLKMVRNIEIGLEFGSAGPIWMRLLFVWPDPTLIWLCFNHKSIPTFQPAGMRLLYKIAARICNCFIFTLLFSHLIVSFLSYFVYTVCPASPLAEAEVSSSSTHLRSSAANNCLVSSTTTLSGC